MIYSLIFSFYCGQSNEEPALRTLLSSTVALALVRFQQRRENSFNPFHELTHASKCLMSQAMMIADSLFDPYISFSHVMNDCVDLDALTSEQTINLKTENVSADSYRVMIMRFWNFSLSFVDLVPSILLEYKNLVYRFNQTKEISCYEVTILLRMMFILIDSLYCFSSHTQLLCLIMWNSLRALLRIFSITFLSLILL